MKRTLIIAISCLIIGGSCLIFKKTSSPFSSQGDSVIGKLKKFGLRNDIHEWNELTSIMDSIYLQSLKTASFVGVDDLGPSSFSYEIVEDDNSVLVSASYGRMHDEDNDWHTILIMTTFSAPMNQKRFKTLMTNTQVGIFNRKEYLPHIHQTNVLFELSDDFEPKFTLGLHELSGKSEYMMTHDQLTTLTINITNLLATHFES